MNSITMKMQADQLIRMALQEDITSEDVSTNAVMPTEVKGTVDLIAKEDGIIAGLDVYARVFQMLDEKTEIDFKCKDGDEVKKGELLATLTGDIRVLLSGERVALNYLQRMSGIATYTRQVAKLLEGSKVTLLDVPNNNSGTDAVTMKDGRHVLIYNNFSTLPGTPKGPRTPLCVAISEDGISWKPVLTLEDSPISQYSYPSIIEGKDGKLHAIYTWRRQRIKYAGIDPLKF